MKFFRVALTLAGLVAFTAVHADSVNPADVNTFTANTPAVASEVNANFTALINAINDNASRIAALESAAPPSASPNVSGNTYQFKALFNALWAEQRPAGDGGTNSDARVSMEVKSFSMQFGTDGTGTYSKQTSVVRELFHGTYSKDFVVGVSEHEIQTESEPTEAFPLTFSQNGTGITVSLDGDTINFIASADGSTLIGVVDAGFGAEQATEILIGVRQ